MNSYPERINTQVKSIRTNVNMSKVAWQRLRAISAELGWSIGKTTEFILTKMLESEVKGNTDKITMIIKIRNGRQNLIDKEDENKKRIAMGIFFKPQIKEYLKTIKFRYGVSVSSFLEQIFLHDDLLRLWGLSFAIKERQAQEDFEPIPYPTKTTEIKSLKELNLSVE